MNYGWNMLAGDKLVGIFIQQKYFHLTNALWVYPHSITVLEKFAPLTPPFSKETIVTE